MADHDLKLADRYHAAIAQHLDGAPPFALLDYPDHSNVGDAAIFLGEVALFSRAGVEHPAFVTSVGSFLGDLDTHCPEGPVFLHGGGNFGDLWPRHHQFRLRILRKYRHRRIIQLPQSIHFADPAGIATTARAIAEHGDFHLMVRDRTSLALARRHFDCPVELVPDAAHVLSRPASSSGSGVLVIARADKERGVDELAEALQDLARVSDWPHDRAARRSTRSRLSIAVRSKLPATREQAMKDRFDAYIARAEDRVDRGLRLLEGASVIVSDRLHVHILSEIIERRHFVLDNSYGKLSSYIETWGTSSNAVVVTGTDELVAALGHSCQE